MRIETALFYLFYSPVDMQSVHLRMESDLFVKQHLVCPYTASNAADPVLLFFYSEC